MRLALTAVVVVAAFAAGAARADTVPIVNDGALPWVSGETQSSPIEVLAGQIASTISGRTVSVRCEGENDWALLAAERNINPAAELGYVPFWIHTLGGVQVGAPFADTYTILSPTVCFRLNAYALAATKQTKCSVTRTVPQNTTRTVREQVKVTKRIRVKVKGHYVVRTRTVLIWKSRQVTDTTTTQVTDPPTPCYSNGAALTTMPQTYWDDYYWYVRVMLTLAHESIHLQNDLNEMHAACYGLQWIPYVAGQLGASPEDVAAIGAYAVRYVYPNYQFSPGYWSPDCVDGGALDLHPSSSVWP